MKTGSVELLVGLLAEELVRRGHEVTVFATGDSRVSARVVSLLPRGYHHDESVWDWELAEFMQLGEVFARATEFDLIHSHVYCWALPFTRLVKTPTIHTFHICPPPDFIRYCRMYPEGTYVVLSEFQRRMFEGISVAATIPNGIDTSTFSFNPRQGTYLAYLGDIREDKGPLECIRLARKVGVPLRIAGPASRYYHDVVQPEVDHRTVEYVGEVDHQGKVELLGGAMAMLFPVTALEACPLVLLESMACGTPVLGIARGPVTELVAEGIGGISVADFDAMGDAVADAGKLDRAAVRKWAVDNFDISRMGDRYVDLYVDTIERRMR